MNISKDLLRLSFLGLTVGASAGGGRPGRIGWFSSPAMATGRRVWPITYFSFQALSTASHSVGFSCTMDRANSEKELNTAEGDFSLYADMRMASTCPTI